MWALFFPILVLFDNIFGVRFWAIDQTQQLCVYGAIAGDIKGQGTVDTRQSGYVLVWMPFFGLGWILETWQSDSWWVKGFTYTFDAPWYIQLLIWLFLIVPITIFTWYIYEPEWSVRYRGIYTEKVLVWWRNRKNKEGKEAIESGADNELSEL